MKCRPPVAITAGRGGVWSVANKDQDFWFRCGRRTATVELQLCEWYPRQEAVCSSIEEMCAPQIYRDRLTGSLELYPWIDSQGLPYFRSRIPLAQRDVEHGLDVTLHYVKTPDAQQRALDILRFKLDILWSRLDAIEKGYPV